MLKNSIFFTYFVVYVDYILYICRIKVNEILNIQRYETLQLISNHERRS